MGNHPVGFNRKVVKIMAGDGDIASIFSYNGWSSNGIQDLNHGNVKKDIFTKRTKAHLCLEITGASICTDVTFFSFQQQIC